MASTRVSAAWAREFISEVAANNSVSEFLDRLEQIDDVCGKSVCQAVSRSWHPIISSYVGDTNSLRAGITSFRQTDDMSSLLWAQIALDFTWRKLNSGNWKDVCVLWREAYATAALFKAMNLLSIGKLQEALVVVDKGILLGAPVFCDALKNFACTLTHEIQEICLTSSDNVYVCDNKSHKDTSHQQNVPQAMDVDYGIKESSKSGIGKVVFRNYKAFHKTFSCDMVRTTIRAQSCGSGGSPLSTDLSTVPLIDMSRRIAVVFYPSLEEFYHSYMISSTFVVISGAMDHWPAYAARKWRCTLLYRKFMCLCINFCL